MKLLISLLLLSAILISGCIQPQQNGTAGATEPGKELTTTISPARDLTGIWEGPAQWRNNVGNPACSYEGRLRLNFQQNGNNLAGTMQATITKNNQLIADVPCSQPGTFPPAAGVGTVSSSSFKFIEYSGTFTSDLMQGTFESCPNQVCNDGSGAVGAIGSFSLMR